MSSLPHVLIVIGFATIGALGLASIINDLTRPLVVRPAEGSEVE